MTKDAYSISKDEKNYNYDATALILSGLFGYRYQVNIPLSPDCISPPAALEFQDRLSCRH